MVEQLGVKGYTITTKITRDPYKLMSRRGYKWFGILPVEIKGHEVFLWTTGVIAQWFSKDEIVKVVLKDEPKKVGNTWILGPNDYELYRMYRGEEIPVWPVWRKTYVLERKDPLNTRKVYEYKVVAREALSEEDYMEIVNLEQHHYASKEEIVAIWRCPICGYYTESNIQPKCPKHGVPMKLQEIRGSIPSSRFLVLELLGRKEYEPRIVAYVRVDTPIPLMNRRLPNGKVEKMIREKVFPKKWFHPTFWPTALSERRNIISRYKYLKTIYGRRLARAIVGEEVSGQALKIANTAAARIARVVVHPDYRGDGLGVLSVKAAIEWIRERRIPEMKKRKHIVETIAMMARYNPFFEKAGFYYMWDTGSGRPVLMYPLTLEAEKRIREFLEKDPYAKIHCGKLYRSRYGTVEKMSDPIIIENLTKTYSSILDVKRLPPKLRDVLLAFGVKRRVVEKYVLRNVNIVIGPGEIVVVVGASGAGKTTFLRMIIGAVRKELQSQDKYKPTEGTIKVPPNTRLQALLPGELEPSFGSETLLEHVSMKIGDPVAAVEVLNMVGLSDAVFYRARFTELSTGQKERAKLASLLAEKPNLLVIDEFTAHLDALTAQRVARKVGLLARKAGITLIVATNRSEIIETLNPDKIIYIGYGTAFSTKP
ncbi:ABC transporter related protein [Staphylothermus hellenicus DSM 12710]|uniref:ABC transporter related protein n=2 Tax=Staphylothermus hellenicus TaxID=84599 RepID=D7DAL0_STAHD|nr:GNAT family N-acetyltransferase [Staphylothermus hellenicus]ADI31207.1 ABC transporter related protein [Staphylothermus hellenicus DSM 12710]